MRLLGYTHQACLRNLVIQTLGNKTGESTWTTAEGD